MDINQILQMIQGQGGRGQMGQGQPIQPRAYPPQQGMPQFNQMGQGMPMQQQISPEQQRQMAMQQMWQKMNSGGNILGIPVQIFQTLPAPTKQSLQKSSFPQLATIFQGLQKDAGYIRAKNQNDIPQQKKRIEQYLKAFNLYQEPAEAIGDGG